MRKHIHCVHAKDFCKKQSRDLQGNIVVGVYEWWTC